MAPTTHTGGMTPESLENRVVRLEERGGALRNDLNNGLKAIRDETAEIKNDFKDFRKEIEADKERSRRDRRQFYFAFVIMIGGLAGTFILQLIQTGSHP